MEPDFLAIENVIHAARHQRSEQLGVLICAGLNWCQGLFSATFHANRPQAAVWRVLPP